MKLRIKEAAKSKGVSINELSEMLGVTRQTITYYITQGDKNPVAQLERIASALGVKVVDLFEQDDSAEPQGICPHCGKPIKIHLE